VDYQRIERYCCGRRVLSVILEHMKLSAVVIVKNEEKDIEDCLKSLLFCDEIVIIDDDSIDKTTKIAKKYNARIYRKTLASFSDQRNYGLEKALHDWVLFIDADERVGGDLREEIKNAIWKEYDGYFIKRNDFFIGKELKYGDLKNVWLMRLANKKMGKWEGRVHEVWKIKGKTGKLKNSIMHNSHTNLKEFIQKIDLYSTLRAHELREEKIPSSLLSILLYPLSKFAKLYILKLGFLDGIHGFVHAVFMSMYSFLVRAKLYLPNEN